MNSRLRPVDERQGGRALRRGIKACLTHWTVLGPGALAMPCASKPSKQNWSPDFSCRWHGGSLSHSSRCLQSAVTVHVPLLAVRVFTSLTCTVHSLTLGASLISQSIPADTMRWFHSCPS